MAVLREELRQKSLKPSIDEDAVEAMALAAGKNLDAANLRISYLVGKINDLKKANKDALVRMCFIVLFNSIL